MTTREDAEAAARTIGDYYAERDMPQLAKMNYDHADAFVPPKPEWADGALYRVTIAGGERYVTWSESEGMWALGGDDFGSLIDEGDAQKVEPLRVLADDEIAVRAAFIPPSIWRKHADHVRGACSRAAATCDAIADALEAGEATR